LEVQQEFYDQQQSFVVCDISPEVEQFLDESEILDLLNYTPTESEAWDIVQMEEIERDILGTE
jgi:anti-anti-sigma regulatory factor